MHAISMTLKKHLSALAAAGSLLAAPAASATLIGDEFLVDGDYWITLLGSSDEGIGGTPTIGGDTDLVASGQWSHLEVESGAESLTFHIVSDEVIDFFGFLTVGARVIWSASDLDWLGTPGEVTGVTYDDASLGSVFAPLNPLSESWFGIPDAADAANGFAEIDIVAFQGVQINPGDRLVSFHFGLEVEHYEPVPDGGTTAALLGMALLGLRTAKRRLK